MKGAYVALLAVAAVAGGPPTARAANTCNAFLEIGYGAMQPFSLPGDTVRVAITLGSGSVQGGSQVVVNRVRFDLDCDADSPLGLNCVDDGAVVTFAGDTTITSDCVDDQGALAFSSSQGISPNQILLTPSRPVVIPANTLGFCSLEFDVVVAARSNDSTDDRIEQVAGFSAGQRDARCDNNLASAGSQSAAITLCPGCDDGDGCTTDTCNQQSGECTNTPRDCDDGNACTTDRCDSSTGECVNDDTVSPTCSDDVCAPERCNTTTGRCEAQNAPLSTPCEADDDPCTVDHCDGNGNCVFLEDSPDPSCAGAVCGDILTAPCVVKVGTQTFDNLQDAIAAAPDGAAPTTPTVIRIEGVCDGPARIDKRKNLTIEGVPPTDTGCPNGGLRPPDLRSTVTGLANKDPDDPKLEVFRITRSTDIVVQFLNIVDGPSAGIEPKREKTVTIHCNCIARHGEYGVEMDGPGGMNKVTQNLVRDNEGDGINLDREVGDMVIGNISEFNGDDGIELEDSDTEHNIVMGNFVRNNGRDGIELDDADLNEVTDNQVTDNGTSAPRDCGVELQNGADGNLIDGNTIINNVDGLTNLICCRSGQDNTGSNVTPACE
jgi:parallel beta-helix repeat protein